jgi:hypothetical protein
MFLLLNKVIVCLRNKRLIETVVLMSTICQKRNVNGEHYITDRRMKIIIFSILLTVQGNVKE